jgi:hypothetical protein
MFRNVHAIRRIVGALAVAAVLTTAIPAEAAGSGRPAAPGLWESVLTWFGEWTGVGPVLGNLVGNAQDATTTTSSDDGPFIDPLGRNGSGLASGQSNEGPRIDPDGVFNQD